MTLTEQIAEIKTKYPDAWAYIKEIMDYREQEGEQEGLSPSLPQFDDNDDLIGGKDNERGY
jgi:hypothetical protein